MYKTLKSVTLGDMVPNAWRLKDVVGGPMYKTLKSVTLGDMVPMLDALMMW